jgi:hypothetical protein
MHVGRGDKTSKTEAMHVPAKLNQETIPKGMMIKFREGAHIHFTRNLKYLGSKLTSKLSDNRYQNPHCNCKFANGLDEKVVQMQGNIKKNQEVSIPSNITNHCTRGV